MAPGPLQAATIELSHLNLGTLRPTGGAMYRSLPASFISEGLLGVILVELRLIVAPLIFACLPVLLLD
jgi:hypothetical protein